MLSANSLSRRIVLLSAALLLFISNAACFAVSEDDPFVAPPGVNADTIKKFNEGFALTNSGKVGEAADIFKEICSNHPNFAQAFLMYGLALSKAGKPAEAEVQLLKANSIQPDIPQVLINLGSSYQLQGRYQDALKQFNRYLQLYPKGTHSAEISAMVNSLKTEAMRNVGVVSSEGKDNYLSEAVAIGAARWLPADMPLKVYIAPGGAVREYKPEYAEILRHAFDDWVEASGGKLSVTFVDTADGASIICEWGDDPKEVVNPDEGGQTILTPSTAGGIVGRTKIKILTTGLVGHAQVNPANTKQICLHEVGHALGLMGHSSNPGDVMFTTVNYTTPLTGLSERDKKTLSDLYSQPESFFAEHQLKPKQMNLIGFDSNPQNKSMKMNNDGLIEFNQSHYVQALKMFQDALKVYPKNDSCKSNIGSCYYNIGRDDYNDGKFASAEKNTLLAVQFFHDYGNKELEQKSYSNLAIYARAQKHEDDAKKYEAKSEALKK